MTIADSKTKENEYDFFISHASEDKDSFVRPLVEKLTERGYNVWYDEMSLNVGDSLIDSISSAIKTSSYGIIVLSKNFFTKKWTKKELNVLLNKEIITDTNLILPFWLNLDINDVFEFSPLLADKLAISIKSTKDIDSAIKKLEKKLGLGRTSKQMIREKIEFLLDCTDDRRNKYFLDLERRIKSIFLYQEEHYNWYISDETFNDENPWDEILISKNANELRLDYNLPNGIWFNEEPFPWHEINRAIGLCSKWVFRKLNFEEAFELHFLLEDVLDTDIHYILYGFPHLSVRRSGKDVYNESVEGIMEVGIKNSSKREVSQTKFDKILSKIFSKYYGR